MPFLKTACMAFLTFVLAGTAHAKDVTIVIHHMEFETLSETFSVGDVITFDNQSDMAHNLYVTYTDGTVDNLDTQFPGMKRKVTLRHSGPARIKCWIHPIINLDMEIAQKTEATK